MSPLLSTLELELHDGDGNVQCGDIVESFACLSSVSTLSMRMRLLPFFGRGPIPASLPTKLESLKILTLKLVNFESLKEASLVLCLLRSSPNLERLEIQLCSVVGGYDEEAAADFIEAQDFSDTFSSLRVFTLECFKGWKNEMLFLELVLSKATHLEYLHIEPQIMTVIKEDRMFASLKQLVREASPSATFSFKKDCGCDIWDCYGN